MMSPQDVLQAAGQRVIAPRANLVGGQRVDAPRTTRDDRRRQSHNEGEWNEGDGGGLVKRVDCVVLFCLLLKVFTEKKAISNFEDQNQ